MIDLQTKILEYTTLNDWEISNILNSPDPNLPIKLVPTQVGPGIIMETLGPSAGALLLDTLTSLSTINRPIYWALEIIKRGELDLSTTAARDQIDLLVNNNIITTENAEKLKALAYGQHQSWAEHNNIIVNARTIGLARGGI